MYYTFKVVFSYCIKHLNQVLWKSFKPFVRYDSGRTKISYIIHCVLTKGHNFWKSLNNLLQTLRATCMSLHYLTFVPFFMETIVRTKNNLHTLYNKLLSRVIITLVKWWQNLLSKTLKANARECMDSTWNYLWFFLQAVARQFFQMTYKWSVW